MTTIVCAPVSHIVGVLVLELAGVRLRGGGTAVEVDAVDTEARFLGLDRHEHFGERLQRFRCAAEGDDAIGVFATRLDDVVAPEERLDGVLQGTHSLFRVKVPRLGRRKRFAADEGMPATSDLVDPLEPESEECSAIGLGTSRPNRTTSVPAIARTDRPPLLTRIRISSLQVLLPGERGPGISSPRWEHARERLRAKLVTGA